MIQHRQRSRIARPTTLAAGNLISKNLLLRVLRAESFVMIMALMLSCSAYSQVGTGTLTGRVTDAGGAVVPDSTVTATSGTTGQTRQTVTDSTGIYSLPSLTPGTYVITVEKTGFQTQTTHLDISIDHTESQDFRLGVSGTTSTIEVQAGDSTSLQTESHEISSTINGSTLQDLPQSGRDIFSKLESTPSVFSYAKSNANDDIGFFHEGGNSVSVGGVTNGNTSYLQDGVVSFNLLTKTANLQPTPEDVEQVSVQQNGSSARYDEPSVINIVTKGGSNQFHGQAYDYFQNDDLNAKGYYDTTKAQQRWNQFGGNFGGPILKNRLQFFFAYDGFRQHSLGQGYATVPTTAMFQGNFTGIDPSTNQQITTIKDPSTGLPFPGNIIPSGRITPFAQAVISIYPAPNGSFLNGRANYSALGGSRNTYDSFLGRLDYKLGQRDTLYGAWETTNPLGTSTSVIDPTLFNSLTVQNATNAYVTETHVFGSKLVTVGRFGYNGSTVFNKIAGAGKANYTQQFGIPFVTPSLLQEEPPELNFNGFSGVGNAFDPDGDTQKIYQYAGEVNQQIGKHSLFYGVEADHFDFNSSWVIWNNSELDFNGTFTGNTIADLLLGFPHHANGGIGYTFGDFKQLEVMPYVQDDWKITPRLTLNLGLRYDYYQSPNDANGHSGVFHPGTNSVTKGTFSQQYDSFAPRFGVAYALNDKTAFHAGYGIYYSTFLYNELQFLLAHPPNYTLEYNELTAPTPIADVFTPVTAGTNNALGAFTTAENMPWPKTQEWNVSVQRSLGSNYTASLSYLGSKTVNIQERYNGNQASLAPIPSNPTPLQSRRPYPNLGDVQTAGDIGWANYNALQAELIKRFTKGFSFNANYVWAKSLDTSSQDNTNPRDANDLGLDYGPSDFDRTNQFKLSGVWELPIGPGRSIAKGNNWFNRQLLGGWQTSGQLEVLSGTPFTVYTNNNPNIGGNIETIANQTCSNPYATQKSVQHWLNPACFAKPADNTIGNEGRGDLRGPRETFFDASASKNFPITERVKIKFAADLINAFNHPDWFFTFNGQTTYQGSNFGKAYIFGSPRVIQLSLHAQF